MKEILFIILAALALVIEVKSNQASTLDFQEGCARKTGATEDEYIEFITRHPLQVSRALRCYLKCVMEQEEIFRNGRFMPPDYSHLPNVHTFVESCKNITSPDECDTAYLIAKCLRDYVPNNCQGYLK